MNEPAPGQPTTLDSPADLHGAAMSSRLGYDHPCQSCDYNLRGLELGACCPECNHPVADSLRRKLLRHADPVYVSRLRSGARMITITALMPLVGLILLIPLALATALMPRNIADSLGDALTISYLVLMWAFFLFGWVRLTTMDPSTTSGSDFDGDRPSCRALSVLLSVLMALGAGVLALMSTSSIGPRLPQILLIGTGALVLAVILMIQFRLGIRQVKRIASRIPMKGLVVYATFVYWLVMSAIVLLLLQIALQVILTMWLINSSSQPGSPNQFQGAILGVTVILGIIGIANFFVTLAAYAMYIGLFSRLWSQLSKVVKQTAVDHARS